MPSTTASVLLRCLTVCVFICLAAAAGFYLLTAFTEDISTHRREMNAAAYKAQIYFDQREALLRYLGDSVLAGNPDAPAADSEGVRQLPLDGPGGQPGQRLLLSARAEHTLQALQTHLLLIDARGAHWLAGARSTSTWCTCHRCVRCRHAAAASRVQTRCTGCGRVTVALRWRSRYRRAPNRRSGWCCCSMARRRRA